jgi:hypothetical protein
MCYFLPLKSLKIFQLTETQSNMKNHLKSGICILIWFLSPCINAKENNTIIQGQNEYHSGSLVNADSTAKQNSATIFFTRQSSMMGALVPHFVIDRGDSLNLNAFITQKKTFSPEKSNFDVAQNVSHLYLITDLSRNVFIAGKSQEGDTKIKSGTGFELVKSNSKIPLTLFTHIESQLYYFLNSQNLIPNIRVAGVVGSGKTMVWERAPGTMQLEVITLIGDQAFAPAFKVEAGKSYEVSYIYMKAQFEISEKKK